MKNYYPEKPTLITLEQPLFKELELREDVVAEPKYNGTRLILKRYGSGPAFQASKGLEFWNRQGKIIKYSASKELLDQLDQIKWEGDCVLDGELLHFKTIKIKHTVVLFDILVWNGEQITNKPFSERRALLENVSTEIKFSQNVLLAPQWKGGVANIFWGAYNLLTKVDEIEGIVIKSLNKPHKLGRTESPVVKYNWKVRKPGPSYRGGENWRHGNEIRRD
jgi:ATP-dependent DNA ligase